MDSQPYLQVGEIIVSALEHHSNIVQNVVWKQEQHWKCFLWKWRRVIIDVLTVYCQKTKLVLLIMFLMLLEQSTHWEIINKAHRFGAAVLIDDASSPHIKPCEALDVDFYVASGHKSTYRCWDAIR